MGGGMGGGLWLSLQVLFLIYINESMLDPSLNLRSWGCSKDKVAREPSPATPPLAAHLKRVESTTHLMSGMSECVADVLHPMNWYLHPQPMSFGHGLEPPPCRYLPHCSWTAYLHLLTVFLRRNGVRALSVLLWRHRSHQGGSTLWPNHLPKPHLWIVSYLD